MKGKKPKGLKRRPKKMKKEKLGGKLVVLDGKREMISRTGMNRDIPMGGAGGSSNLMSNLVGRGLAVGPPQPSIQTPDQFKLAQDISSIRTQQADIKEAGVSIAKEQAEIKQELAEERTRKVRSDKGGKHKMKASGQEEMTMTAEEKAKRKAEVPMTEAEIDEAVQKNPDQTFIMKKGKPGLLFRSRDVQEQPMSAGGDPLLRQADPMRPRKVNTTPIPYDDIQAPLPSPDMPTSLAPEGEPK